MKRTHLMHKSRRAHRAHTPPLMLLLVACCGAAAFGESAQQDSGKVVRRMPSGFRLTFTPKGLTSIELADRTIAEGSWRLINDGCGDHTGGRIVEAEDQRLRIHQRRKHATAEFTYTIDGEDLTIEAYVRNRHPERTLGTPKFGELTFRFRGEPGEAQQTKHSVWGWLNGAQRRSDGGHMNPGWANRMGGSYAWDADYGLGATPLNRTYARTRLGWGGGRKAAERTLSYAVRKPIPPGAARTIRWKVRLSTRRDWKHLLRPYKDHYQKLYGGVHYEPDWRFCTQAVIANKRWGSPGNPHRFNPNKRLDKERVVRRFYGDLARRMEQANGQGEIIWANTGWDERWKMFRTDFDVMPPAVQANWPLLNKLFKDRGVRHGICVRPAELTYRGSWWTDQTVERDGTDPAQVARIRERVQNMRDRGCDIFYFDVFGHHYDHIPLGRKLRRQLGPDVPAFVEHPTDAILAYHGAYHSIRWNPKKGYYIFWNLGAFWKVARWLTDYRAVGLGSFYIKNKSGKKPQMSPLDWAWRRGMAPMVHDADFHDHTPKQMRRIQSRYVEPDGRLKDRWRQVGTP